MAFDDWLMRQMAGGAPGSAGVPANPIPPGVDAAALLAKFLATGPVQPRPVQSSGNPGGGAAPIPFTRWGDTIQSVNSQAGGSRPLPGTLPGSTGIPLPTQGGPPAITDDPVFLEMRQAGASLEDAMSLAIQAKLSSAQQEQHQAVQEQLAQPGAGYSDPSGPIAEAFVNAAMATPPYVAGAVTESIDNPAGVPGRVLGAAKDATMGFLGVMGQPQHLMELEQAGVEYENAKNPGGVKEVLATIGHWQGRVIGGLSGEVLGLTMSSWASDNPDKVIDAFENGYQIKTWTIGAGGQPQEVVVENVPPGKAAVVAAFYADKNFLQELGYQIISDPLTYAGMGGVVGTSIRGGRAAEDVGRVASGVSRLAEGVKTVSELPEQAVFGAVPKVIGGVARPTIAALDAHPTGFLLNQAARKSVGRLLQPSARAVEELRNAQRLASGTRAGRAIIDILGTGEGSATDILPNDPNAPSGGTPGGAPTTGVPGAPAPTPTDTVALRRSINQAVAAGEVFDVGGFRVVNVDGSYYVVDAKNVPVLDTPFKTPAEASAQARALAAGQAPVPPTDTAPTGALVTPAASPVLPPVEADLGPGLAPVEPAPAAPVAPVEMPPVAQVEPTPPSGAVDAEQFFSAQINPEYTRQNILDASWKNDQFAYATVDDPITGAQIADPGRVAAVQQTLTENGFTYGDVTVHPDAGTWTMPITGKPPVKPDTPLIDPLDATEPVELPITEQIAPPDAATAAPTSLGATRPVGGRDEVEAWLDTYADAADSAPPPAEGMTRLYRFQPADNPEVGAWFSTDRDQVLGYMGFSETANVPVRLLSVDVPTSQLDALMARNQPNVGMVGRPESDVVLPPELSATARDVLPDVATPAEPIVVNGVEQYPDAVLRDAANKIEAAAPSARQKIVDDLDPNDDEFRRLTEWLPVEVNATIDYPLAKPTTGAPTQAVTPTVSPEQAELRARWRPNLDQAVANSNRTAFDVVDLWRSSGKPTGVVGPENIKTLDIPDYMKDANVLLDDGGVQLIQDKSGYGRRAIVQDGRALYLLSDDTLESATGLTHKIARDLREMFDLPADAPVPKLGQPASVSPTDVVPTVPEAPRTVGEIRAAAESPTIEPDEPPYVPKTDDELRELGRQMGSIEDSIVWERQSKAGTNKERVAKITALNQKRRRITDSMTGPEWERMDFLRGAGPEPVSAFPSPEVVPESTAFVDEDGMVYEDTGPPDILGEMDAFDAYTAGLNAEAAPTAQALPSETANWAQVPRKDLIAARKIDKDIREIWTGYNGDNAIVLRKFRTQEELDGMVEGMLDPETWDGPGYYYVADGINIAEKNVEDVIEQIDFYKDENFVPDDVPFDVSEPMPTYPAQAAPGTPVAPTRAPVDLMPYKQDVPWIDRSPTRPMGRIQELSQRPDISEDQIHGFLGAYADATRTNNIAGHLNDLDAKMTGLTGKARLANREQKVVTETVDKLDERDLFREAFPDEPLPPPTYRYSDGPMFKDANGNPTGISLREAMPGDDLVIPKDSADKMETWWRSVHSHTGDPGFKPDVVSGTAKDAGDAWMGLIERALGPSDLEATKARQALRELDRKWSGNEPLSLKHAPDDVKALIKNGRMQSPGELANELKIRRASLYDPDNVSFETPQSFIREAADSFPNATTERVEKEARASYADSLGEHKRLSGMQDAGLQDALAIVSDQKKRVSSVSPEKLPQKSGKDPDRFHRATVTFDDGTTVEMKHKTKNRIQSAIDELNASAVPQQAELPVSAVPETPVAAAPDEYIPDIVDPEGVTPPPMGEEPEFVKPKSWEVTVTETHPDRTITNTYPVESSEHLLSMSMSNAIPGRFNWRGVGDLKDAAGNVVGHKSVARKNGVIYEAVARLRDDAADAAEGIVRDSAPKTTLSGLPAGQTPGGIPVRMMENGSLVAGSYRIDPTLKKGQFGLSELKYGGKDLSFRGTKDEVLAEIDRLSPSVAAAPDVSAEGVIPDKPRWEPFRNEPGQPGYQANYSPGWWVRDAQTNHLSGTFNDESEAIDAAARYEQRTPRDGPDYVPVQAHEPVEPHPTRMAFEGDGGGGFVPYPERALSVKNIRLAQRRASEIAGDLSEIPTDTDLANIISNIAERDLPWPKNAPDTSSAIGQRAMEIRQNYQQTIANETERILREQKPELFVRASPEAAPSDLNDLDIEDVYGDDEVSFQRSRADARDILDNPDLQSEQFKAFQNSLPKGISRMDRVERTGDWLLNNPQATAPTTPPSLNDLTGAEMQDLDRTNEQLAEDMAARQGPDADVMVPSIEQRGSTWDAQPRAPRSPYTRLWKEAKQAPTKEDARAVFEDWATAKYGPRADNMRPSGSLNRQQNLIDPDALVYTTTTPGRGWQEVDRQIRNFEAAWDTAMEQPGLMGELAMPVSRYIDLNKPNLAPDVVRKYGAEPSTPIPGAPARSKTLAEVRTESAVAEKSDAFIKRENQAVDNFAKKISAKLGRPITDADRAVIREYVTTSGRQLNTGGVSKIALDRYADDVLSLVQREALAPADVVAGTVPPVADVIPGVTTPATGQVIPPDVPTEIPAITDVLPESSAADVVNAAESTTPTAPWKPPVMKKRGEWDYRDIQAETPGTSYRDAVMESNQRNKGLPPRKTVAEQAERSVAFGGPQETRLEEGPRRVLAQTKIRGGRRGVGLQLRETVPTDGQAGFLPEEAAPGGAGGPPPPTDADVPQFDAGDGSEAVPPQREITVIGGARPPGNPRLRDVTGPDEKRGWLEFLRDRGYISTLDEGVERGTHDLARSNYETLAEEMQFGGKQKKLEDGTHVLEGARTQRFGDVVMDHLLGAPVAATVKSGNRFRIIGPDGIKRGLYSTEEAAWDAMQTRGWRQARAGEKVGDVTTGWRPGMDKAAQDVAIHKAIQEALKDLSPNVPVAQRNRLTRGVLGLLGGLNKHARETLMFNALTGYRGIMADYLGDSYTQVTSGNVEAAFRSANPLDVKNVTYKDIRNGSVDAMSRTEFGKTLNELEMSNPREAGLGLHGSGREDVALGGKMYLNSQVSKLMRVVDQDSAKAKIINATTGFVASERIRDFRTAWDLTRRANIAEVFTRQQLPTLRETFFDTVRTRHGDDAANFLRANLGDEFGPSAVLKYAEDAGIDKGQAEFLSRQWRSSLNGLERDMLDEVKRVAFDYSPTNADEMLRKIFMFHTWQLRAAPLYMRNVLKNPALAAAYSNIVEDLERDAQKRGGKQSGFLKLWSSAAGYAMFASPAMLISSVLINLEPKDFENPDATMFDRILAKVPAMANPVVRGIIYGLGYSNGAVPDFTTTSHLRRPIMAMVNYGRSQGWFGDDKVNSLAPDFVDGMINKIYGAAYDWVGKHAPGGDRPDLPNPNAQDNQMVQARIRDLVYEDYEVPMAITLEQLQRNYPEAFDALYGALTAWQTGAKNEYANQAFGDYTGGRLAATGAALVIPGGTRLRSESNDLLTLTRDLAENIPDRQEASESLNVSRLENPTSTGVEFDQNAVQGSMTAPEKKILDQWTAIAFGDDPKGMGLMFGYSNDDVRAMSDDERQQLADMYIAQHSSNGARDMALLESARAKRDAARAEAPYDTAYRDWASMARAMDEQSGEGSFARETARGNPNYAKYIAAYDSETSNQTLSEYSVNRDAYLAFLGEKKQVFDPEPLPVSGGDAPYMPPAAIIASAQQGMTGGSTKKDPLASLQDAYRMYNTDVALYQNALVAFTGNPNASLEGMNPMLRNAVEWHLNQAGISAPSKPQQVEQYETWAQMQQGLGQPNDMASYITWREQFDGVMEANGLDPDMVLDGAMNGNVDIFEGTALGAALKKALEEPGSYTVTPSATQAAISP